ncbi:MAG TPA: alpha/beta fold hydrolase [Gemmataceae bacterium]|nr:alpha/beta fold hydrolase [Gemmataceae bacterium]
MTPATLSTPGIGVSPPVVGRNGPPREFRPLPLLGHPHIQTLLGHILPGPAVSQPTLEHVVRLPDGDGLMLYDNMPPAWRMGGRMALLVHGLTGSAESPGVQRIASRLLAHGLRVVRMDQRGAGKGLALARGAYNASRSADVRAALEEIHRWSPDSPIALIGISLGGALVLKTAGEMVEHPAPYLERVAAMNPPINLARCAALMELPRNRIYNQYFIKKLVGEAEQRQRFFSDLPPLRFPRRVTIRLFDDLYTAPRGGFADALDYYRQASAAQLVPRISVPTLILTARDDPFIAVGPFEELQAPENVVVQIVQRGGHIGFVGWDGSRLGRWAESRVVEWIVTEGRE